MRQEPDSAWDPAGPAATRTNVSFTITGGAAAILERELRFCGCAGQHVGGVVDPHVEAAGGDERRERVVGGREGGIGVAEHAGRDDEMAYQEMLKGLELKRDIETILLQNQKKVAGDTTTARKTGAVLSWIKTNTSKSAAGGAADGIAGLLQTPNVKGILQVNYEMFPNFTATLQEPNVMRSCT